MRCAPTSTVASNSHTSSSGSLLTPPRLTVRNPFAGRGNKSMTVVPEARAAAAYGVRDAGVTAMHDATEGGVLGGLYEVAEASGVGLRINQSAIPIRPEVAAVCAAAGIDPYVSISEGTLVATVRPQHAEGLLAALARANISAADVGEVLPASAARTMLDADGREVPLTPPRLDPYWEVFARWSAQ